jgi:hypothetical protein
VPMRIREASSSAPLPDSLPHVVWRAGLDLNPIDLGNSDDVAWLETLVWPEQNDRLDRLRAAIAIARSVRPLVVKGDLLVDLPALAAQAPSDATLVVFHSAVLAYVSDLSARMRFAEMVRDLGAVWVSNETPNAFPAISARTDTDRGRGRFLLAVDGGPVAWTHSHGAAIEWLG